MLFGVAEVAGGYGSLAAFVGGIAFRRYEREHQLQPGRAIDDAPTLPISVDLTGPRRLELDVDATGVRLHWDIPLARSSVTGALNAIAAILPPRVRRHPLALEAMSSTLGPCCVPAACACPTRFRRKRTSLPTCVVFG